MSNAWKPQLSSFWLSLARAASERAEHHRQQPALAALGGRDQAPAGGVGVPGLHAVDVRIDPQQPVAVRLRDVVVAEFLQRVERVVLGKVADQRGGEQREVGRGRVVLRVGQARRIREVRVRRARAAPPPRSSVSTNAASLPATSSASAIDASLPDCTIMPCRSSSTRHRLARLDEHARAFGLPRALRHVDHLRRRDRLVAQRAEHDVRGHQLGERRRIAALVGILGDDASGRWSRRSARRRARRSPAARRGRRGGCGRRRASTGGALGKDAAA